MIIGAWDIGHSTGVCVGSPDHAPRLSTVRMPDPGPGMDFGRAADSFLKWAEGWIQTVRPARLYIEAPFAAERRTGVDLQPYIEMQFFYANAAAAFCVRYGVSFWRARVNHVRLHFCDNGNAKDKQIAEMFHAVLGAKPADSHQADSFALWHYAIDDQLDLAHPFVLPHHREAA